MIRSVNLKVRGVSCVTTVVDYYALLEVTPVATSEQIKKHYRRLSFRYHPDHGGSTEQMARLNTAYEVLTNTLSRRDYDREIAAARAKAQQAVHQRTASQGASSYAAYAATATKPQSPRPRPEPTPRYTWYQADPAQAAAPHPKSAWMRYVMVGFAVIFAVELIFIFGPSLRSNETTKTPAQTASATTNTTPTSSSATSNPSVDSQQLGQSTDSATSTNTDTTNTMSGTTNTNEENIYSAPSSSTENRYYRNKFPQDNNYTNSDNSSPEQSQSTTDSTTSAQ